MILIIYIYIVYKNVEVNILMKLYNIFEKKKKIYYLLSIDVRIKKVVIKKI